MLIALLVSLAAQTDPTTPEELAPPVVELAPTAPPPRPPSPSLAPSKVVPAPDAQTRNDDVTTTFIQMAAGVGACCVGSCVALPLVLVPVAGPVLYNGVIGAGVGATEALVGDAVGRKRGGLVPAIATGAGISLLGIGAAIGVEALVPLTSSNSILLGEIDNPDGTTQQVRLGASAVITAVATVATIVVPAIVYQATATEEAPLP